MGVFDRIIFEDRLPGIQSSCRRFQTKSLHRCLDHYIVTKEGRLQLLRNAPPGVDEPFGAEGKPQSTDTDFHGDIRLISDEGEIEEYVARFTHGTLEWIRPLAGTSELSLPPQ